jgi:predicted dehydrogenase
VIVEKPLEITRAAIAEMLRVQQETGVKLAVISQHRFDPDTIKVHDLVEARAFGRLYSAMHWYPGGVHKRTTTVGHGAGPGNWMVAEN